MSNEFQKPQLGFKDSPLIFLVVVLSFVIHELAHGACGRLLGYDMFVEINKAGLASGQYSQEWHIQLVSVAGPIVTLLIALTGLWLIYRYKWVGLFPVVFFSAIMRAMAAVVSISNPNDEARVSQWLGMGKWTLPLLVVFALGWVAFLAARKLELNWKSWTVCYIVISTAIAAVVLTESYWPVITLLN